MVSLKKEREKNSHHILGVSTYLEMLVEKITIICASYSEERKGEPLFSGGTEYEEKSTKPLISYTD